MQIHVLRTSTNKDWPFSKHLNTVLTTHLTRYKNKLCKNSCFLKQK